MNFTEQLRRQIGFLQRSCADYDTGHIEEGLRIAVTLRVLFHDTSNSTSLLTHLATKNLAKVLSTFQFIKEEPGVLVATVPMWLDYTGSRQPPLGDSFWNQYVSVNEWLEQIVMSGNNNLSRQDVILAAANQDGGAHVDPKPKPKTDELIRGVGTFSIIRGGTEEKRVLDKHHFPLIRQFGYEVLNSPDILGTQ